MVLVYAMTTATQHGWGSTETILLLAFAAVLGAGFLLVERRAASPLLPFEVFRGTTLGVATVITVIVSSVGFSQFFLLTLYLQQVLHYSARAPASPSWRSPSRSRSPRTSPSGS